MAGAEPTLRSGLILDYQRWAEQGYPEHAAPGILALANQLSSTELMQAACADMRRRARLDEDVRASDYFERFPELESTPFLRVQLLHDEFVCCQIRQRPLAFEEFVQRHPGDQTMLCIVKEMLESARQIPFAQDVQVELESFLGQGGFCCVFRGRQRQLNRPVAIKLLSPVVDRDDIIREELLARFQREAEICTQVEHPHVVTVYSAGMHQTEPYLVMELLDGGSLIEWRERTQPGAEESARMIRDAARGVGAVHQLGAEHRDLKPENMLLTRAGVVKIVDFNLSRLLDTKQQLMWSRSGYRVGTQAYQAPEAIRDGNQRLPYRSDVYSLGVVLYELLAGQLPIGSRARAPSLEMVESQLPLPLRETAPGTPPQLEQIVYRCLKKRPEQRYADADALADDLDRFLEGKRTRGLPLWSPLDKPTKLAAIAILSICLLMIVGVGAMWRRAIRIGHARELIESLRFQKDEPLTVWPQRIERVDKELQSLRNGWLWYPEHELATEASEVVRRDLLPALQIEKSNSPDALEQLRRVEATALRWGVSIDRSATPDFVAVKDWDASQLNTSSSWAGFPFDGLEDDAPSNFEVIVELQEFPDQQSFGIHVGDPQTDRFTIASLGNGEAPDRVLLYEDQRVLSYLPRYDSEQALAVPRPPVAVEAMGTQGLLIADPQSIHVVHIYSSEPLLSAYESQRPIKRVAVSPNRQWIAVAFSEEPGVVLAVAALDGDWNWHELGPVAGDFVVDSSGRAGWLNDEGQLLVASLGDLENVSTVTTTGARIAALAAGDTSIYAAQRDGAVMEVGAQARPMLQLETMPTAMAWCAGALAVGDDLGRTWVIPDGQPAQTSAQLLGAVERLHCRRLPGGDYVLLATDATDESAYWIHRNRPRGTLAIKERGLKLLARRGGLSLTLQLRRDGALLAEESLTIGELRTLSMRHANHRLSVFVNGIPRLQQHDWEPRLPLGVPLQLYRSPGTAFKSAQVKRNPPGISVDPFLAVDETIAAGRDPTPMLQNLLRAGSKSEDYLLSMLARYRLAAVAEAKGEFKAADELLAELWASFPKSKLKDDDAIASLAGVAAFRRWANASTKWQLPFPELARRLRPLQANFQMEQQDGEKYHLASSVPLPLLAEMREQLRRSRTSNKDAFLARVDVVAEREYVVTVAHFLGESRAEMLGALNDLMEVQWLARGPEGTAATVQEIQRRTMSLLESRSQKSVDYPERAVERVSWFLRTAPNGSAESAMEWLEATASSRREEDGLLLLDLERARTLHALERDAEAVQLLTEVCQRTPAAVQFSYGHWAEAHLLLGILSEQRGKSASDCREIWRRGSYEKWRQQLPPSLQGTPIGDHGQMTVAKSMMLQQLSGDISILAIAKTLLASKDLLASQWLREQGVFDGPEASRYLELGSGVFASRLAENSLISLGAARMDIRARRAIAVAGQLYSDSLTAAIHDYALKQQGFDELYQGLVQTVLLSALAADLKAQGETWTEEEHTLAAAMFRSLLEFYYRNPDKIAEKHEVETIGRLWFQDSYRADWKPVLNQLPAEAVATGAYFFGVRYRKQPDQARDWIEYGLQRIDDVPEPSGPGAARLESVRALLLEQQRQLSASDDR